ncbi:MAG: hypothetical protein IJS60_08835 [Abditibacteriota bacterium]|nr:hypothetical protein [Abditibacteriota bacterium]
MAIVPSLPFEYKLFKCVQYFQLEKDKDYSVAEIDLLYEKLKAYMVLDSWEFPNNNIF